MDIKSKIERRTEIYKRVFGTDDGKLVLEDLADFCRMKETAFVPGDIYGTVYQEGMKNVYLHILRVLNLTDKEISELIYETYNVRR